ncbi:MAG: FGGY-family carbohydrate kinase, partial [Solirubrobacteraceae bacterium]
LIAQAGAISPPAAPGFLPYLAPGEQGALWNADLYGTIFGLRLGHGAAELARGLLNGIVLESRRCVEVLADAGLPAGEIRIAGWCASDAGVCRDLADCCRRPVRIVTGDWNDGSAIGAARLLAAALGQELAQGAAGIEVAPDERRARVWDGLWERHERMREAATVIYEPREASCMEK